MRHTVLAGLCLLIILGCGGDDAPVAPTSNRLEDAVPSTTSPAALGKVYIENLPQPDQPENYEVLILSPVPATRGSALAIGDTSLLVQSDDTGPYFRAPLHPTTPNSGGAVQLQISDGEDLGTEFTLDVDSLPAAPGAFQGFVDVMRTIVEQRASFAGTSIAELANQSFGEVDPMELPLKIAQMYVDSDEQGSLTGLVEDTAGFLSADERELLDRLLGYAPIDDLVQADIDTFTNVGRALPGRADPGITRRACLDLGPPISTAEQLATAMMSSALADVAINPNGAPGRTLEALEVVLVGGSALPAFGRAFGAMASGVAAWETAADFTRSVFPNQFVELTYDFDRTEFDEDEIRPGIWSNVMVTAISEGWDASEEIAKIVYDRLKPDFPLLVQFKLEGARYLEPAAMLAFNSSLQDFLEEHGNLSLCPQRWTIDITGQPWSTGGVLARKFDVDPATQKVRPLEVGSDMLRIAAQPSVFGGREIEKDLAIKTNAISVTFAPVDITVSQPGETVQFTATIENAQVETLGWSTSAGTFEDGLGNETPGGASRSLKTPTTPEAYPVIVRAESKSRQGLRSSGEPTRVGILTIRTGGSITIEPSHACIEPGETQQFIAIVTGLDNYTVNWNKLEGYGNIDENGLYTSLSGGTSSAIIEATVVERPEMKDEATVAVNSCVCSLDVTIGGHSSWSHASSDVAYLVSDFGDLFYQFYFEIGGSETQGIGASLTGTETVAAPRPGDTGTWRANFVYFDGSGSWVSIWDDENGITGVSVTIDELTDAFMTGTFHGQAVQLRLDGKTVISFVDVFVQFRAGNWDGGRWPCGE